MTLRFLASALQDNANIAAAALPVSPGSYGAWVALVLGVLNLAAMVFAWGKWVQKMEAVKTESESHRKACKDTDASVRELQDKMAVVTHTLWGAKGDNGMSSVVRQHDKDIDAIQRRNIRADAIAEIQAAGADRQENERRQRFRRATDKAAYGGDDEPPQN